MATPHDATLEILTGGHTTYRVTDLRGEQEVFAIPHDLPLPMAAALLSVAESIEEKTLKDSVADWTRLLESFLPIVQLRHSDVTLEHLRDSFGVSTMAQFIAAVVERLHMALSPKAAAPNRAARRAPQAKAKAKRTTK